MQMVLHALTLPVRMLLSTDGNVTALLEACFGAPVVVETVVNDVDHRLPTPLELDLRPGRPVLWRQVVLHVAERPALRASSVIALDRLDAPAREGLLAGNEPIGSVLRGLETRRELLASAAGTATAADVAALEIYEDEPVYERSYRIVSAGSPLAVVTERVPASIFDALA